MAKYAGNAKFLYKRQY